MTDELKEEMPAPTSQNVEQSALSTKTDNTNKQYVVIGILVGLVLLTLVVLSTLYLIDSDNSARTEQIRDVFIIFMALEALLIGIALVVLIVQLSNLINLLQNEIRPIINSTNETVNTLKGTAKFVSDNLAEPVIKINQYAAMLKRIVKPSKK